MPGHRNTTWKLPALILAVLFVFAAAIRAIERVPNPGYAERTGTVDVEIQAPPEDGPRAIQLRVRCGTEVVDTIALSPADFDGATLTRAVETSAAGECVLGVRSLPSTGDFEEAVLHDCRVTQQPRLGLDCQAKGTMPSSQ